MTQAASTARAIRRARLRRLTLRFNLWVVLPTFVAVVYYGCLATAQYESVSTFTVTTEGKGADARMVRDYMVSRDMLARLIADHGFDEHYQTSDADFMARLAEDASSEEKFEYFRGHVSAVDHQKAGTIELRVRAFTAKAAHDLSLAIAAEAERALNAVSMRSSDERAQIAEKELESARQRLIAVRTRLEKIGAEIDAEAAQGRTPSALRIKLDQAQADLAKNSDRPDRDAVIGRIEVLRGEIAALDEASARHKQTQFERDQEEKAFGEAFQALEEARRATARDRSYVVAVSAPSQPSAATHPRRVWKIVTVFVVATALMIVITLIVAGVREHGQF